MRVRERCFDVVGASSSQRATDPLYCEILDGPSERSASTCGERPRWQMGCLRRKKHMVRHHLRWNIAWYRDLHLKFWPDTRLVRMAGSFLHSRYTATDLVCPVLLVFRWQSRNAKVHFWKGKATHCDLLWAQRPWICTYGRSMESHLHVGTLLGTDLYEYFWELLLVFFTHTTASVYEQDTQVRYKIGKLVIIYRVSLFSPYNFASRFCE